MPAGAAARRAACAAFRSIGPSTGRLPKRALFYGDVLGQESHVYGYEVDGLDYEIRNGRPQPTAESGAPDGLEILAMGMASQVEEADFLEPEDQFFGDEDGRFIAETLYGEASDENLEKVRYSNGMIVNFRQGKGEVFHAGSCEWVAGLLTAGRDGRARYRQCS